MPRPNRPKITKVLVDQALTGNKAAWVELVDLVQSCIHWRIARTLLLARRTCPQDIRDVQQMTLVALLLENNGKLATSWDPSRGSFETFARLIGKQKALVFLKPLDTDNLDGIIVPEPKAGRESSPEEMVAACELGAKALEQLKAEQTSQRGRDLLDLLIMEKRTTEEVRAIMVKMTPSAIDQRRKRLQDRLKEILSELGGGE